MSGPPPPNEDSEAPDPINESENQTSTTTNHSAAAAAADEHNDIRQRLIDAMNSRYERANETESESDRRGYNGIGFSAAGLQSNDQPTPEEPPVNSETPRPHASGPHFFITSPNGPSFLPLPQGITDFTFSEPDNIRLTSRQPPNTEPSSAPPPASNDTSPNAPPNAAPNGTPNGTSNGTPNGTSNGTPTGTPNATPHGAPHGGAHPIFSNGFGGFRFEGFNADGRAPPLHFTSIPPNSTSVYYVVSFREDERPAKASERALQNLKRIPLSEIPVDERECTICYEPLTEYVEGAEDDHSPLAIPECGHFFGASCLKAWLQTSASCPLCRTPLESDRSSARDDLPFHVISSLFDGFRSQGPSREPSGEPRSDNSDSDDRAGNNGPRGHHHHHHHGEPDLRPIIENIFRSIFHRIHDGFRAPNRDTNNDTNTNGSGEQQRPAQQQQAQQPAQQSQQSQQAQQAQQSPRNDEERDAAASPATTTTPSSPPSPNPWLNTGNANAARASGLPLVLGSPSFANIINIVRPSPAVLRERQSRVMRQAFDSSMLGARRQSSESTTTPSSANASPPSPATPSTNVEISTNQPIMWPPQNHLDDLDSIIRNAVRSQRGPSSETPESTSDDTEMRESEEPSDDPVRRSGPSRRNTTRRHPYQRP